MAAAASYLHVALTYYNRGRHARHAGDAHQVDAEMLSCELESKHLVIKMPFHDDPFPCKRHSGEIELGPNAVQARIEWPERFLKKKECTSILSMTLAIITLVNNSRISYKITGANESGNVTGTMYTYIPWPFPQSGTTPTLFCSRPPRPAKEGTRRQVVASTAAGSPEEKKRYYSTSKCNQEYSTGKQLCFYIDVFACWCSCWFVNCLCSNPCSVFFPGWFSTIAVLTMLGEVQLRLHRIANFHLVFVHLTVINCQHFGLVVLHVTFQGTLSKKHCSNLHMLQNCITAVCTCLSENWHFKASRACTNVRCCVHDLLVHACVNHFIAGDSRTDSVELMAEACCKIPVAAPVLTYYSNGRVE